MADRRWGVPISQMPSAKILLGFPGHDDPKDEVDDQAGESGEDGENGVKNPDQRGIPAEPLGQSAAHPAEHPVVGKHQGHGGVVSPCFFFVQ